MQILEYFFLEGHYFLDIQYILYLLQAGSLDTIFLSPTIFHLKKSSLWITYLYLFCRNESSQLVLRSDNAGRSREASHEQTRGRLRGPSLRIFPWRFLSQVHNLDLPYNNWLEPTYLAKHSHKLRCVHTLIKAPIIYLALKVVTSYNGGKYSLFACS